MVNLSTSHVLMQYLLGELSTADRENVEKQYFVNQDVWDALNAAEDDLIDSYVYGRLSRHEQEQFERHFLASPQKRKRVELVKALKGSIRKPE